MKWIWQIAVRKAVQNGVKVLLALYGAKLSGVGITLNGALLVASILSGLELLRNWFKVRWGVKWL